MDLEHGIRDDQAYSARGIVARIDPIGELQYGMMIVPIYKYLTLDCGKGQPDQAVKFVSPAPRVINSLTGEEFLDMQALKPGQIVVNPGLLYEKVDWTTPLHTEHLKALQIYRPKDILMTEAPGENDEIIDGGVLNMATDSDTKSLIHDHISKTKH